MGEGPGLTIGGLAEACGISVETVRYYERRELLEQPPRPVQGYRRYGQDDIDRIAFVQRAKQLGFTLNEIRELIISSATGGLEEVLAAARDKLQAVRRQEEEARRLQRR